MKNLILYVLGVLFLFASCQPDELQSDELVQTDDLLEMKAMDFYKNFQSNTDWSKAAKSPNANQVTKKWTMRYSYATRYGFFENPADCSHPTDLTRELQIDGQGQGSLFGNFTFTNRACFKAKYDNDGELMYDENGHLILVPISPLLGVVTTAAGDQFYFVRQSTYKDVEDPDFTIQYWIITGGSEDGRFERASGELYLRGNQNLPNPIFTGWGEIRY